MPMVFFEDELTLDALMNAHYALETKGHRYDALMCAPSTRERLVEQLRPMMQRRGFEGSVARLVGQSYFLGRPLRTSPASPVNVITFVQDATAGRVARALVVVEG